MHSLLTRYRHLILPPHSFQYDCPPIINIILDYFLFLGASTVVYAAASDDVRGVTGKYYGDSKVCTPYCR